jgi:hypothetical protein
LVIPYIEVSENSTTPEGIAGSGRAMRIHSADYGTIVKYWHWFVVSGRKKVKDKRK